MATMVQVGAPENPLSAEQVREKFRANAGLAGGSFDGLEEAILTLEEQDGLRAVFSALACQPVAAA